MFSNNTEKTEMMPIKRTSRKFEELRRMDTPIDFSKFLVSERPSTPTLTPPFSPTPIPSPILEEDEISDKGYRDSSTTYRK